ncbi:hypothetical protein HDU93_002300 [Gonapodya sp. JEL0774]|nr:hypothetical protein HDU93_002300 [Gonapodya sp. JEL0774]
MEKQRRRKKILQKIDQLVSRNLAVAAVRADVSNVYSETVQDAYRTLLAVKGEIDSEVEGSLKREVQAVLSLAFGSPPGRQSLPAEAESLIPSSIILDDSDPFIRALLSALSPSNASNRDAQNTGHGQSSLMSAESLVSMGRDLGKASRERTDGKLLDPGSRYTTDT